MKEIESRADVAILVDQFYAKIRKDDKLGPIFNGMIKDWNEHLELLTNFWSTQLFLEKSYKGNPIEVHRKVDAFAEHQIDEDFFGAWLNYWVATIDELFEGERSAILKNRARKMASFIHIDIFRNRS